jgi:hypothetical protein
MPLFPILVLTLTGPVPTIESAADSAGAAPVPFRYGQVESDGPSLIVSDPGAKSAADLLERSRAELLALFDSAEPGPIVPGEYRGWVTFQPNASGPRVKQAAARLAWRGKIFHADGTMTNRLAVGTGFPGVVSTGPSRRDGRDAVHIDYADTAAWPMKPQHDEIRPIGAGRYLGLMYHERKGCGPKAFFVLEPIGCRRVRADGCR